MKKKIFYLLISLLLIVNVYAASSSFTFDGSKIFRNKSKSENLALKFDQSYKVSSPPEEKKNEELKDLAKEATYYLLGPANSNFENTESYIKRKQAFYSLRYAPEIPLDIDGNLATNSQEFAEDLYTGYVIPNMFIIMNDLEIQYEQINNVSIVEVEDGFYAKVSLKKIKMNVADENIPMNYKTISADLDIYYYFRLYKGKYKLYYLYGEYDNSLNEYNEEVTQNEYKGLNQVNEYKSTISSLYNYNKLNLLSNNSIKEIYNKNKSNILIFNTMNGQAITTTSTGFLISKDLAVTTWSYLEKSLINGNYITVSDGNGKQLEIAGVVTIDINHNYAVLKLKNSTGKGVIFGNKPNIEDAVILISTKTGTALSTNTGIVISNESYISNLIPTVESEEGAPVFNSEGRVIGMNNSEIVNSYFSKANGVEVLQELQNKFSSLNMDEIKYVTFEELKNNYYVKYETDKVMNKLSDDVWNRYKKIGNLEENINLELVKASYKNGILSLRYKNKLSSVFENMQLTTSFIDELRNSGYSEMLLTLLSST